MPKPFTDCVKKGGRVRTVQLGKNKYRHVCTINGNYCLSNCKWSTRKERNNNERRLNNK